MSKDEIDHKQFVADFITEMNEQNNRGTATPYFYQIRDIDYIASYHEDEFDRLAAVNGDSPICSDTFQNLLDELIKCHAVPDSIPEDMNRDSESDIEEFLNDHGFSVYREKETEKLSGVFFTESDAKNHLESNSHHYSNKADTYVNHCWRAPQLEQFFKSVGQICGVEFKRK